jgi:phenylalanyl-tRNA synthetase beta chain
VGAEQAALFETGRVFLGSAEPLPAQPIRVAGALAGPEDGFFRLKGVLEALHGALQVPFAVERTMEPFLHPGRAARFADGFVGTLHPEVAEGFGIEAPAAVFELDLAGLAARVPPVVLFRDVVSFPPLRQDIAVVVEEEVEAGAVVELVREAGGETLAHARVFDVYRGSPVPPGRKSLALRLVFQAPDRTLTDAEGDAARRRIVEALREQLGGELRG